MMQWTDEEVSPRGTCLHIQVTGDPPWHKPLLVRTH